MYAQASCERSGETTLVFEVLGRKRSKRSGLDELAQKSPTVIIVDSLEQASDALSAFKGAAQNVAKEACASLDDEDPTGGLPKADGAVSEALL